MKDFYNTAMFYLCSDEMPFTIRIEFTMKDTVIGEKLEKAYNKAIRRYPHFAVRAVQEGESIKIVPNDRPLVVYRLEGEPYPINSEKTNYHLMAVGYEEKRIHFFISHVITDGGGCYEYLKTVLYYYLCERYGITLDSAEILLADSDIFDDELIYPATKEILSIDESPLSVSNRPFFRLSEGGYVTDHCQTAYCIRINEAAFMRYNFDNDGSPCVLISSMMSEVIRRLHPDEKRDIVSAVSVNLRPAMKNRHYAGLLSDAIKVNYPYRLHGEPIRKICTCARGMVMLRTQPESLRYSLKKRLECLSEMEPLNTLAAKKAFLSRIAFDDALDNTFSISYVGKMAFGSSADYVEATYTFTDASTYGTIMIEVSVINGWFDVVFLQGFSSDVYYREFVRMLREAGIEYLEEKKVPFHTPKIELP